MPEPSSLLLSCAIRSLGFLGQKLGMELSLSTPPSGFSNQLLLGSGSWMTGDRERPSALQGFSLIGMGHRGGLRDHRSRTADLPPLPCKRHLFLALCLQRLEFLF